MLMTAPSNWSRMIFRRARSARAISATGSSKKSWPTSGTTTSTSILDKGADRFLVPAYEREAIRPHVLGKFRDLLAATAKSPAMLFYLDNWQSRRARPRRRRGAKQGRRGLNENYARELMELHTLGVDGGYTQKDVTEVARCFTGWTIRDPKDGEHFQFNERSRSEARKSCWASRFPRAAARMTAESAGYSGAPSLDRAIHIA